MAHPSERIIAALDFPSRKPALEAAAKLQGIIRWMKIGLELYVAEGNRIVSDIQNLGFSVFLDLKFHDIPNTVAGAVRTAAATGAKMLTVHASGGPVMLAAAQEAAAASSNPPKILAVTVLTSMDAAQLSATGVAASPAEQVKRLAAMAYGSGIRGFVSSPEEVATIRAAHPEATLVIPGIRPAGAATGDQKRIATPASAVAAGADYLVIGRPIMQAADPAAAAQAIVDEIATARS
ncbi:orotidine-5'-phosphate decarboxylase [Silvibacterium acidisoli]|uniref:orotidine-5'-phosphate decarboxylase n=1 Tax=Acidobacteriaceae bacterium ZG23-2 TaxID=2883246 RepID=UPI00406D1BBB